MIAPFLKGKRKWVDSGVYLWYRKGVINTSSTSAQNGKQKSIRYGTGVG